MCQEVPGIRSHRSLCAWASLRMLKTIAARIVRTRTSIPPEDVRLGGHGGFLCACPRRFDMHVRHTQTRQALPYRSTSRLCLLVSTALSGRGQPLLLWPYMKRFVTFVGARVARVASAKDALVS